MSYAFIAKHEKEYAASRMCRALGPIRAAYRPAREPYGNPHIHTQSQHQGFRAGRYRIVRLIAQAGLVGQDFTVSQPNRVWLADITYVQTGEGWLYLALVIDFFARFIVGWSMVDHLRAELIQDALLMAFGRRLLHSDLTRHPNHGCQYTSALTQALLRAYQVQGSTSGVTNCFDNAPIESFIGTLKTECLLTLPPTRAHARPSIFDYIEVWHNRPRLHSALDCQTPADFERRFYDIHSVHCIGAGSQVKQCRNKQHD